jgi:hypothetical protein
LLGIIAGVAVHAVYNAGLMLVQELSNEGISDPSEKRIKIYYQRKDDHVAIKIQF